MTIRFYIFGQNFSSALDTTAVDARHHYQKHDTAVDLPPAVGEKILKRRMLLYEKHAAVGARLQFFSEAPDDSQWWRLKLYISPNNWL